VVDLKRQRGGLEEAAWCKGKGRGVVPRLAKEGHIRPRLAHTRGLSSLSLWLVPAGKARASPQCNNLILAAGQVKTSQILNANDNLKDAQPCRVILDTRRRWRAGVCLSYA